MKLPTRSALIILAEAVVLFWLLSACTPEFAKFVIRDIPVDVYDPGTQRVNFDRVYQSAQQQVSAKLPNAYFAGMVFSGKCRDLPQLEGELALIFLQVRPGILQHQVLQAIALIDTISGTMDVRFTDESSSYPVLQQETFVGDAAFKDVARIAYGHLSAHNADDYDVTVTQQQNSWAVRCGGRGDFVQQCSFRITDGKIKDKSP